MPKKKKEKRRVKVLKVVPIEPEKTLIELEVEGPPPSEIPAEPLQVETLKATDHPFIKFLKDLW